jgi:hypothetical protein
MESCAKRELSEVLRRRYQESRKAHKTKILDEFMAITGHHRKTIRSLLIAGRTHRGYWNFLHMDRHPTKT